MDINKSTRHQKIIGKYGELLICNWLSRSGFEVTIIDHTGIDIIAYHSPTKRRLGISVKSRTRNEGKESDPVNIFSFQKNKDDRKLLLDACNAFQSEPWIAVYVEAKDFADLYLTSLDNYDENYRSKKGLVVESWKMNNKAKSTYDSDLNAVHLNISFKESKWSWDVLKQRNREGKK
jgi:hypothetical protein